MIQHIVFFTFKEEALGMTREELKVEAKKRLEALRETIPYIRKLIVGIDYSNTQNSFDISLYTEFDTNKDLENYQVDPYHVEVKEFMVEVLEKRAVVDAEI